MDTRQSQIDLLRKFINSNHEQIEILQEENLNYRNIITNLQDEINLEAYQKLETVEDRIKFFLVPSNCTGKMYGEFQKFWKSLGVESCGAFNETNQTSIQIDLNNDGSNIEQVYEALTLIEPFIIPLSETLLRKKGKVFKIFEFTLSLYHVTQLVKHGDEWIVMCGRREEYKEKDLKKVLAYIAEHHYYERIETETDED